MLIPHLRPTVPNLGIAPETVAGLEHMFVTRTDASATPAVCRPLDYQSSVTGVTKPGGFTASTEQVI